MQYNYSRFNKHQGFTLIELMVVVSIVALLASVAIPSYRQYIVRSNRADAQEMLTTVMFEMERYSTRNRTYTTNVQLLGLGGAGGAVTSSEGNYSITAAACGTGISNCVALTATPVAGSTQVTDGVVTLNSRGVRSANWASR